MNISAQTAEKRRARFFGDTPDAASVPPAAQATASPSARSKADLPKVRIVRSEPEPTLTQAAIQGLKEGVADAVYKIVSKVVFWAQFILALVLTKKLFPSANNGIVIIVILTAGIAAMLEIDLVARMMGIRQRWLDAETLQSRVGVIFIIGFGCAYALAIFLAVSGG